MTVRQRPRVAALLGLLALAGSASVLPYLHTCFPSAAGPLAVRAAGDAEASETTHGRCAVCALASTVRMSLAIDAGPLAPPPERTALATGVAPRLLADSAKASATPRAPPSFS
jgi:hypothetical protein